MTKCACPILMLTQRLRDGMPHATSDRFYSNQFIVNVADSRMKSAYQAEYQAPLMTYLRKPKSPPWRSHTKAPHVPEMNSGGRVLDIF